MQAAIDVIAQNVALIAALSKGGGGNGNGSDNSNQGKGKGLESQDNETALREWISKRSLLCTIIGPHWPASSKS